MLTLYSAWFKHAFRTRFAFKVDLFMQILSTLIDIVIRLSIWKALLGTKEVNAISYHDMVVYVIVGALVQVIIWSSPSQMIIQKVKEGSIVYEMIRPYNLINYLVIHTFGRTVSDLVIRAIPSTLIAILLLGKPALDLSIYKIASFSLLLVTGFLIFTLWEIILGVIAFWLKEAWWANTLSRALIRLFAGTFVPLWFFPEWLYKLSSFLPFKYMYYIPLTAIIGDGIALQEIGMSFLWAVALGVVLNLMWRQIRKRVSIQGG